MRENFFRDFGDATLVQNLFKQIRAINRTNSRPIWTPTCEDIDHIAKNGPKPPPKNKNPHVYNATGVKSTLQDQEYSAHVESGPYNA